MSSFYHVFGLTLETNQPIPGITPSRDHHKIDVRIDFTVSGNRKFQDLPIKLWYQSPKDNSGNFLTVWKLGNEEYYRFQYTDSATFIIESSGKRVWVSWKNQITLEDITAYLLGHILGFILGLRGFVCLHASAIAVDQKAIVLLAPSGAGKSTTAAAFSQMGYAIITDDIVAISEKDNQFLVQPGYPRLKIWPGSQKILNILPDSLPRISPEHLTWDKRYIDLTNSDNQFQPHPLKMAAIYTGDRAEQLNIPEINKISGSKKIITILSNLYRFPLISKIRRSREFDTISRIAKDIPLRRIRFQRELSTLPILCQYILDDLKSLNIRSGGHDV